MKVLLSAYSCLPNTGSENGIGWNWACSLAAEGHDVTVLTRAIHRASIESHLASAPHPCLQFIYCDWPSIVHRLYRLPFGNYLHYLLWQRRAASIARAAHRAKPFDLVQHITWGNFRIPSFMGSLGIPFVFGPVGGGEDTPPRLRAGLGFKGRLWDALRRLSNSLSGLVMSPIYASADHIVVTTQETFACIPARFRAKTILSQAVGIDPKEFQAISAPETPSVESRFELLFAGRLLAWKGLHLLLRALAKLRSDSVPVRLTVIGSGPDQRRLQRLALKLGVDNQVRWISWMPRGELLTRYREYSIFAFPSLHDSGGAALLEAMIHGLPVLCLNLGGPGLLASPACGVVLDARAVSEEDLVAAIAAAIVRLRSQPQLLAAFAEGARARVRDLTWLENVRRVYGQIGAVAACSPDLLQSPVPIKSVEAAPWL